MVIETRDRIVRRNVATVTSDKATIVAGNVGRAFSMRLYKPDAECSYLTWVTQRPQANYMMEYCNKVGQDRTTGNRFLASVKAQSK